MSACITIGTHLRDPAEVRWWRGSLGESDTTWAWKTPTASQLRMIAARLCDLCTFSDNIVRSGWWRASTLFSVRNRSGVTGQHVDKAAANSSCLQGDRLAYEFFVLPDAQICQHHVSNNAILVYQESGAANAKTQRAVDAVIRNHFLTGIG